MQQTPFLQSMYRNYIKRAIDLLLSIIVLMLVWPLLIAIYLVMRIKMGSPVMLQQKRPGFRGKPFNICKFRTMTNERDANGNLLPDDQRVTPIGRTIRSYSLDELSEVINILKGEMSFVGPRPLMMKYLDRYTPEQARRHDVMPGLTGWVQVKGRNSLSWEEKFALDVWYVDHQSFTLDLKILFMTIWIVLGRKGISQEGYVAAEEFQGSRAVKDESGNASKSAAGHGGSANSPVVLPWEQGSEFQLREDIHHNRPAVYPWDGKGIFFGSGRDAIKAILMFGMASRGWKRLWLPAYFCQEVVSAIAESGIALQSYSSWYPGKSGVSVAPRFTAGDVVFIVNHFGLHSDAGQGFDMSHASAVIEDHTHDPWSVWTFKSKADYCIASLRKTLPVHDGGVLWSPRQQELPTTPRLTGEHRSAAEKKLESMRLKALFLRGQIADKSGYRALSLAGEEDLCTQNISGILGWTKENLDNFPAQEWREKRKRNFDTVHQSISSLKWVQVVSSDVTTDIVPFSCILLFDTVKRRDFVRTRLIQADIYPAILWSLEKPAVQGIPSDHFDASRRMLSIHCDMRYSTQDMSYVADCIKRFGHEFKG